MTLSPVFQERIHTTTSLGRLMQELDSIRRIVIDECSSVVRDELCHKQRYIQERIRWLETRGYKH